MEWHTFDGLVDYRKAVDCMVSRVSDIVKGKKPEAIWMLEHPSVYTAGTSVREEELPCGSRFSVVRTTRGGRCSYHGPGQRVVYVMLDLKRRERKDVRLYVRNLGLWVAGTLAEFGVNSYFDNDNVGIWVRPASGPAKKIAAFGIAVRSWVTYHGFSVNVNTDLNCYTGIAPCGLHSTSVTSLQSLGVTLSLEDVDAALKRQFRKVFPD
ncbi:lipoyl(octanoyl) transferase LipB [Anaplasma capra]|uniref:lipoyl(octanoyl) transferase LipB n=1 Tax=Anaplasma capra TaxID=1562740 RepID=UPI0037BF0694